MTGYRLRSIFSQACESAWKQLSIPKHAKWLRPLGRFILKVLCEPASSKPRPRRTRLDISHQRTRTSRCRLSPCALRRPRSCPAPPRPSSVRFPVLTAPSGTRDVSCYSRRLEADAATDDPESPLRVASRPTNRGDRRTHPTPTLTVELSTPHLAGSRQAFRGKAFAAARTGAKAKVRPARFPLIFHGRKRKGAREGLFTTRSRCDLA